MPSGIPNSSEIYKLSESQGVRDVKKSYVDSVNSFLFMAQLCFSGCLHSIRWERRAQALVKPSEHGVS